MTNEKIKICKMCFKEISDKAKKCPYCQHWQNKWSLITFHPLFAMIPMIIMLGIFLTLWGGLFEKIFDPGEPFSKHKNSIIIEQTKMKFGQNYLVKAENILLL